MFSDLLYRFRALFRRESMESELDEELRAHLEHQVEKYVQSGMSREEAKRRARIEFGGLDQVKEECRDAWGLRFIDTLRQDLRFGMRQLRKNPGFTVVAVVTLALGIGANTAVFSLVNAVLIRSLPYSQPKRLAYVWSPNPRLQLPVEELTPGDADFSAWHEQNHSFATLALFVVTRFNIAGDSATESVGGARVTADFFPTMGIRPELGRPVGSQDDQPGNDSVAVISHGLWQSMFGGRENALGQIVDIDGRPYEVIGVMPRLFVFPHASDLPEGYGLVKETDVWIPRALTAQEKANRMGDRSGIVIGRLKPGVSIAKAQTEMSGLMARLNAFYPPGRGGFGAFVKSFTDSALGEVRPLMWLLFGSVCLVLLICCSTVMNLQIAQAEQRRRELGLRSALGAQRGRLLRTMLIEALVLACVGGILGVLVAYGSIRVLSKWNDVGIPRLAETSIDTRVLLFTLIMSFFTGILFGVYPAITASRPNLAELLKQGGKSRMAATSSKIRHSLIVAQIALSVMLLAGAGLLIRSYLSLEAVHLGYSPSTLTMDVSVDGVYKTPEQQTSFYQQIISKIADVPGVLEVGATNSVPLTHSEMQSEFMVDGYQNQKGQSVDLSSVTPRYFAAMGIKLRNGRYFESADAGMRSTVSIVNQSFADRYLGKGQIVGRRVCLCDNSGGPWYTVVGEVADIRQSSMEEVPHPQLFVPFWNYPVQDAYIAVKSINNPDFLVPSLRKVMRNVDPMIAMTDIRTVSQLASEATARRWFQTLVLSGFAFAALLLAMVGLYGLMLYSVERRTSELGIRMALGASPRQVLGMIIGEAIRLIGAGLIVGIAGAVAASRFLSSFVYGVKASDPLTFAVVALLLAAVAILASYIPARRAAKVDPMVALRHE